LPEIVDEEEVLPRTPTPHVQAQAEIGTLVLSGEEDEDVIVLDVGNDNNELPAQPVDIDTTKTPQLVEATPLVVDTKVVTEVAVVPTESTAVASVAQGEEPSRAIVVEVAAAAKEQETTAAELTPTSKLEQVTEIPLPTEETKEQTITFEPVDAAPAPAAEALTITTTATTTTQTEPELEVTKSPIMLTESPVVVEDPGQELAIPSKKDEYGDALKPNVTRSPPRTPRSSTTPNCTFI
jgi:hypothetical protein